MRKKILVVEDNAELLDLMRLHLKAAGFAIATATNGIEALKKARSVSPDLVLLDLGLPELDGLAVYETLRNTPATASTPILIVTGLPDGLARFAGLQVSHCELVSKPVNPKYLIDRMKELLRQARGASGDAGGEKGRVAEAAARGAGKATERRPGAEVGSRAKHGQVGSVRRH